jgi:sugar phosphate isomerase/epimerase
MKNTPSITRRRFLQHTSSVVAGLGVASALPARGDPQSSGAPLFDLSLAQWSLHRSLQQGVLDNLDFAKKARETFGIGAVEYVNQFFKDKAQDQAYLNEMKKRASDAGVKSVLIMIDGEGQLGDQDEAKRTQTVENHYKWVDAAKHLGCHSIRVNAGGSGSREEVSQAVVDGLGRLCDYASNVGIHVLVENHGGYSSDGGWLSATIAAINKPNCGTLPDFGNFCVRHARGSDGSWGCAEEYDRYRGVEEMMPYAKAVSAKSHDFDEAGNETHTDYMRMMKIVLAHGYHGHVGIEYEGGGLSEEEGILATKRLLLKVRDALT